MHYESELYHHGIKGQKWGVRRFQNPDGSLTAAGQKRYGESFIEDPYNRNKSSTSELNKEISKLALKGVRAGINKIKQANAEKKEQRAYRNKLINDAVDLDEEFDNTAEGKQLAKEYSKELNKMYNTPNWGSEKDQARFDRAESAYLSAKGNYTAKKLLSNHGEKVLRDYGEIIGAKADKVDDLIKKVGDQYTKIHAT